MGSQRDGRTPSFEEALASFTSDIGSSSDEEPTHWKRALVEETKSGQIFLRVKRPQGSPEEWQKYDLTFLADVNLRQVFEIGLVRYSQENKPISTSGMVTALKTGFVAFLKQKQRTQLSPRDLSAPLLLEFAKHLRSRRITNSTRTVLALAFRTLIRAYLREDDKKDPVSTAIKELVASSTFRSLSSLSRSQTGEVYSAAKQAQKFLSDGALMSIHEAACSEVVLQTNDWRDRQNQITEGLSDFDSSEQYTAADLRENRKLLLAWVVTRYPRLLPTTQQARLTDPLYYNAVCGNGNAIGNRALAKYLYATTIELFPFYLLLLIRLRYNVSTLMEMRWSDVSDQGDVIVLSPRKGRAREKRQVRSEPAGNPDNPLSLRSMLSIVESMTARSRKAAPNVWQDTVFLPVMLKGSGIQNSRFGTLKNLASSASVGSGPLWEFCQKYNLEAFLLNSIRPTLLNLLANGSVGLVGGQREGNHSEPVTTLRHYLSIETSEKRYSMLAEAPNQILRWSESNGKLDPRFLPRGSDYRAATPGFFCLDPYTSPIDLQRHGRLCNSQGHCARCSHAMFDPSDTKLVAYAIAYAEAASTSTELELGIQEELLAGYLAFLEAVPSDVIDRAMKLPKPTVHITN
ncbi:MAG: hypothetical protein AAF870_02660 [Pseudomonadota bacterium]